jgi:hypothetical protein
MKHFKVISSAPAQAQQDLSIGQIISVIAQLLTVIGTALVGKDAATGGS